MNLFITISIIVLILAFILALFLLASIFFIFYTGVPFAKTPYRAIKKIINALDIKEGQIVYDLGCGDGRFLFAAAKAGAKAIGFEISPAVYLKAKIIKLLTLSKAKIKYKNFYSANLADADIIFCFLVDSVMPRVEKKLKAELKPGAKVVSYGFFFPNWNISQTILPDPEKDKTTSKIFIYTK